MTVLLKIQHIAIEKINHGFLEREAVWMRAKTCKTFMSDAEIMEIYKTDKKLGNVKMIEKYSHYIYYMIQKFYPSFLKDTADMYQQGAIGIMNAMKNYHPDKGCFSTYSTPFIKKELSSHVRFVVCESSEYFSSIHTSVERAKNKLKTTGKEVTTDLIVEETGLSHKIVKRELEVDTTKISYDDLIDVGINMKLSDNLIVNDMLSIIPKLNRIIIKMKIFDEMSFASIARQLNITPFRAKQKYDDGIKLLQKNMEEENCIKMSKGL